MKIGIITVFDAVNYGSFLQAFCLQEYLKKMGHEVVMIKRSSLLYEKWRFTSLVTYKPSKFKFKFKLARGYFKQWKLFTSKKNEKELDVLIVGSDEMWEVNNVTFNTMPEFFGNNIEAKVKATYAVSCNSTIQEDLCRYPFTKEGIKKFNYISVRDQATYNLCEPFIDFTPQFSLDPTLIFDLEKYIVPAEIKEYILCYTYSFKPYMIDAVKELATKTKKKIIVVGQQFEWADLCLPATAFEFLGLLKNADTIVTDTFHGTTLSIALRKNFISFAHKKKVFCALELFHMLDRNVNEFTSIYEISCKPIDYDEIYTKWINPLKKQSFNYIDTILNDV